MLVFVLTLTHHTSPTTTTVAVIPGDFRVIFARPPLTFTEFTNYYFFLHVFPSFLNNLLQVLQYLFISFGFLVLG